jgi:hypothetical protein
VTPETVVRAARELLHDGGGAAPDAGALAGARRDGQ